MTTVDVPIPPAVNLYRLTYVEARFETIDKSSTIEMSAAGEIGTSTVVIHRLENNLNMLP